MAADKIEVQNLFNQGNFAADEVRVIHLLESTEISTLERGLALFQLSWIIRAKGDQDSERAQLIDSQLSTLARQLDDKRLLALSMFRQGDRHFCAGRLGEAKANWETALKYFELSGDQDSYEYAYIHFHFGILHRDLFGFSVAVNHLTCALELARKNSIPYLIRQCLTELFFCHFYQSDYTLCVICFEQIQEYPRGYLSEIENLILHAYLNIYQKKYGSARKNLIQAYGLVRMHGIAKNRYDLYFHLAYLYAKKGDFKKSLSFMRGSTDPIYWLLLLELEADCLRDVKTIHKYVKLAKQTGIVHHIENAHLLLDSMSKVCLPVNISFKKEKVYVRGSRISIKGKQLIAKTLRLAMARSSFSKRDILEFVFEFRHYDPIIHDLKVYKLVAQANRYFGIPLFVAAEKKYYVNPQIRLSCSDRNYVAPSVAIREILLNFKALRRDISGKIIKRIFSWESKIAISELKKLEKSQRLEDAG